MRLRALDGYSSAAYFYPREAALAAPQVAVLHCGAGIRRCATGASRAILASSGIPDAHLRLSRYRRLAARMLARLSGVDRGLGGVRLRRRHRVAARALSARRIIGIAHSIGALLVGGAHNSGEQARLVMIGGHTGYYGDYRQRYRVPMTALWHALMPAITLAVGLFPGAPPGAGRGSAGALPCSGPDAAPGPAAGRVSPRLRPRQALLDRCAALQRPALLVSITDDAFATDLGHAAPAVLLPEAISAQHIRFTPPMRDPAASATSASSDAARAALWPRLLGSSHA